MITSTLAHAGYEIPRARKVADDVWRHGPRSPHMPAATATLIPPGIMWQRICAEMCPMGVAKCVSSVMVWYGRQSCGTVHLTTLLLVAIRCVLYRHCYGTEPHASQGLSRALGKTSAGQSIRSRRLPRRGTALIIEYGVW